MQSIATSRHITSGKNVDKFERVFAKYHSRRFGTMTNSGSSALFAAIYSMGWEPGDKIICPAVTFPTSLSPLLWLGLVPILVDIDATLNIDPQKMVDSIKAVKGVQGAVIPHTLGNPCNPEVWEPFDRSVEDNCDALGSSISGVMCGTFGGVSCFSFYPAHHIFTGEGGMTLTNYPHYAEIIRQFVSWGRACSCKPGEDDRCGKRFEAKVDGVDWDHKYQFDVAGGNFKPGLDIQGLIGLIQLEKEEGYRAIRKRNYGIIRRAVESIPDLVRTPVQLPGSDPSWFGCALTLTGRHRKEVIGRIENRGVASRLLFGGNLSRQRFIHGRFIAPLKLTVSDDVMQNTLIVGCNHTITEEEAHFIAKVVKEEVTR
jgi:CDP-6-deoxy-D-xylo-4-hexulose-3-dehydrase